MALHPAWRCVIKVYKGRLKVDSTGDCFDLD
jgi:hypothetical protein